MDAANLVVQLGILGVTAGAGAIAWWQAIVASRAKADAQASEQRTADAERRAVVAAERAAEAASASVEQHARAAQAAEQALPPVWSQLVRIDKTVYRVRNDSSRVIVVTAFEPQPTELAATLARVRFPLPARVEYGDALDVLILGRMSPGIESIRMVWQFEDESMEQVTVRRVLA
ncbi:hypothetical protein [Rathayibacter iranicus]|uniref:Uncharacterized protein n=2 Tax=Rathayibacter iranicus TaxID=59737 RepID=A0AAD2JG56_9MICO|nr:hypothetical protein [Rathayibacter iranicus]AZZ54934.1 hypothetical protein C7V51_02820 [Rathayibacter iranicus]MWV32466.1 hypothetical protein [Rathayibacter iranicus NCPPB 2253 = VKM Ac-1602]PPI62555.1 hypothetical protein C5E08_02830 [Rathayibacter iranicus]PWJ61196.1 hypothetical protein B0H03_11933 [Rathayibacter iranicus NCPPB 2253 = VKM Ac-1602]